MQACFKCGLTRHIDWWSDLEWDIYAKGKNPISRKQFIKE